MDIEQLRKEYRLHRLDRPDLAPSPFEQFTRWFDEARKGQIIEPNAFALATATAKGIPSCRNVLLKEFNETGLLFFTNLESRKAQELALNPHAAATFWWKELERQVLIEGWVEPVDRDSAERFFDKRPRGSQLSAWASKQGEALANRKELEKAFEKWDKEYRNKSIPCPPNWGGFRIIPTAFEFWQGREDRMHDRFRYFFHHNAWTLKRISP